MKRRTSLWHLFLDCCALVGYFFLAVWDAVNGNKPDWHDRDYE